jgi:hypothetical protein
MARSAASPRLVRGMAGVLARRVGPLVADHGRPLGAPGRESLARALGDTPETVISVHQLTRGLCAAYVVGDPSQPEAVVLQSGHLPEEPAARRGDCRRSSGCFGLHDGPDGASRRHWRCDRCAVAGPGPGNGLLRTCRRGDPALRPGAGLERGRRERRFASRGPEARIRGGVPPNLHRRRRRRLLRPR